MTTKTKVKLIRMHNPPHPGEVLQDTVLAEGRISVTEFAEKLGVSRVALSRVVNSRAAVSADMALRLAAALGGSAESWLRMQATYDLWQASKRRRPNVKRLKLSEAVKSLQM
jgi:addiction module HigA family antidote